MAAGRKRITFEVDIPAEAATEEEIERWVKFCLHERGDISIRNPLAGYDMDAVYGSVEVTDA